MDFQKIIGLSKFKIDMPQLPQSQTDPCMFMFVFEDLVLHHYYTMEASKT